MYMHTTTTSFVYIYTLSCTCICIRTVGLDVYILIYRMMSVATSNRSPHHKTGVTGKKEAQSNFPASGKPDGVTRWCVSDGP